MKRLSLNERRQIFLTQQEAEREIRARLLAPIATCDAGSAPDSRRRTWLIITPLAGILLGGGMVLSDVVTLHAPASVIDAVWPKL